MGKTQGAQEFTQVSMGVDNLIKEMLRILGPSEEFATALRNITAAMGEQLRAQRDQITGRKKTAEEEYQDRLRQAHQWNAELKLRKATLELSGSAGSEASRHKSNHRTHPHYR